ncbi:MAG: tetratricopeptide repeat protein, partial [Planctomycetota bacterium]
ATLGQTGDAISAHDGKTAPQLLTGRLRTAVQKPDARSTDEVASAVAALAHIAAVAPASVKNVDGLLTSVRDAFGPGPVSIAVNDALEYLRIDRDNGELPNRADNPEGYATQVRLLGDHVASAVRSGRAYTAALLERLTTKRNDVPAFVFLINALGLHGDIDPPDPSKPDVAAVQWLEQSLKTVPGEMLTRYRPNGVADATWRSHRDAAGSMALALARLGRSETRSWLASRLRDLSHGELQSALELSWALLGGIHRSSPDAPTNQPTDADGWARLAARALDSKDYGVALDAANRGLALDPRHVRSLFERGQILERLGYYDDALRDLDAAVAIQPEANAVWAFRAETLRQMGRLDEALESANRAMKLQSGEFSALLYRARIYREMGRVDEALADLDAVLTRDEGDAATLIEKADIFEELGRFDEARQVCDTLVRLLPNNDRSWSERAQLRMALGDPEGALEDYARALELAPDSGMYVVNRALARDDIGDHEGARVDLEAWLERHPDDALAMNNLGLVLINLGQIERARALLMKATPLMQPDVTDVAGIVEYTIKAGPRPMGFHQIQAASHHFAAGRFEAAEYLARVATRRNPQYATAWHILANSRMGRGICDQEVLDALDQAVRLEPTNPDHRLWRSEARRKNGDLRGAIEDADVALRSPDPSIRYDAYVNRGIARSMSDDAAGAISDYSEAIKLDGTRFNAFNLRGELFSRAGQLDEAMRDHDRAVACADADATAWGNRGITLNALERYDEAIESYTRSLELDPTSTLSLLNRGVSYHRSGRYQQAIADYTRGLQIDPDDEMMHTYRGLTLQAMGRWQDALKDFEAILRNDPDNPNGRLGRSAIRMDHQDDLRGALDDLTVALRSVPENVNAWHNRALVYLRLGEYAHAISDLDRVMTLTPDNEQALLLRAQLRNMTGEFQLGAADAQRARKLEPTDGEAWSCESAALLGLNKLAEAYTVSMQGFRAVTDGGTQGQWYNHACVCGRIATAREAGANPGAGAPDRKAAIDAGIDALDKAVQLGFNNGAHMDSDTDLDGLRKDPRFAAIRARAR